MSLRRHVLQVVALVTAVALVFGAFAGSAGAKKLNKSQKAKIRAELRKQVKKNPGAVKRRAFLRKAALVNFKLPVTIRLRNTCNLNQNTTLLTTGGNPVGNTGVNNCLTQGTALNQRTVPTARVNLGPSLGSRDIALGGSLAAVVEFNDTYDGGALGNVSIKILPSSETGPNAKYLETSSVPLLWNNDITNPVTRSDANFLRAVAQPNNIDPTAGGLAALNGYSQSAANQQGCGDWQGTAGEGTGYAAAGAGAGYKALFHDVPANLGFGTGSGLPGYTVYGPSVIPSPNGVFLPVFPAGDGLNSIRSGNITGNNDYVGPNPFPFPTGSVPTGGTGTAGGTVLTYGGAGDTVLRTNALRLGIAPGGVSVNMSTGTATTPGGLTTAQGSQDVTLGYSGGQANLFGNIPGKNVGIDVTVNLATKINSIVRLMDQDVFKNPSLVQGEDFPAGIFNCRQIVTGAVQNYIPGVRLTGSLRIAPAITKDGKVRIAKATVMSDTNNPDRVALSACLFPAKSYNAYTAGSDDITAAKIPSPGAVTGGGAFFATGGGVLLKDGNTAAPVQSAERYPNGTEGNAPSTTPCNADNVPSSPLGAGLADIIRKSALTGTVSGLPAPGDSAFAGITYNGSQASVAGDITVNPLDVDVLLGDQPQGT